MCVFIGLDKVDWSIKMQKKPAILTEQAWSIKDQKKDFDRI